MAFSGKLWILLLLMIAIPFLLILIYYRAWPFIAAAVILPCSRNVSDFVLDKVKNRKHGGP